MSGHLFVISGPSGAGKGTIVSRVLERVPTLWLSISATTRSPRCDERDGVEYYFISEKQFAQILDENGFLEWANVHGCLYGTLRSMVIDHLCEGDDVLLEIDVQGALDVKENFPDALLIFVTPPSFEELQRRLTLRGTETDEQIELRLDNAKWEMLQKSRYNISVVNDNLDDAVDEIVEYIVTQ